MFRSGRREATLLAPSVEFRVGRLHALPDKPPMRSSPNLLFPLHSRAAERAENPPDPAQRRAELRPDQTDGRGEIMQRFVTRTTDSDDLSAKGGPALQGVPRVFREMRGNLCAGDVYQQERAVHRVQHLSAGLLAPTIREPFARTHRKQDRALGIHFDHVAFLFASV